MENLSPSATELASNYTPLLTRLLIFYSTPQPLFHVLAAYAQQQYLSTTPEIIPIDRYQNDIVNTYRALDKRGFFTDRLTPVELAPLQANAIDILKKRFLLTGVVARVPSEKIEKPPQHSLLAFTLDPDVCAFVTQHTNAIAEYFPQADFSWATAGEFSKGDLPTLSNPSSLFLHIAHILETEDLLDIEVAEELEPLSITRLGLADIPDNLKWEFTKPLVRQGFLERVGAENRLAEGYALTEKGLETIQAIQYMERLLATIS